MKLNLKVVLLSLVAIVSQNTYAAKPFTVEAKCPVQVIDPAKAPKNLPDYFFGTAKNNNEAQACVEAKKDAINKFPQGTKPKHCRCITK